MTDQLRSGESTRPIVPLPHEHAVTDDFDEWLEQQARRDANWDEIYPEPTDATATDRLLGALRYLRRQIDDAGFVADARVAEIREWQHQRTTTLQARVDHIERLLEGWTRAQHELSGGRSKTWNLPNGTLTLRAAQSRLVVEGDEDDVARTLQRRFGASSMVRLQRRVMKDAVKGVMEPGDVVNRSDTPPGYEARAVGVPSNDGFDSIDGLVLLVPTQDKFKATTGADR
jgi:phage host-nuclease inhibitor protein Gam